VPADSILELDWWDAVAVGGLTLTATPSRHFSGRGLTDAYRTLWAGWSIAGDGDPGNSSETEYPSGRCQTGRLRMGRRHRRAEACFSGSQWPSSAELATHCWMKYIPSTPS